MRVKKFRKMYFKKAVIAKINTVNTYNIKGGTRSFEPGHVPNTGQETHCANVVCY